MIVNRSAEGRHGAHGAHAKQWAVRTALRIAPDRLTDHMTRTVQTLPHY